MIAGPIVFRPILIAVAVMSTACATLSPARTLQLQADRSWDSSLTRARALAVDGHQPQADSVLALFGTRFPTANQSIEATYWRALFNLRAPAASQRLTAAIPLLQSYLAAGSNTEHWMEADALLRAATRVDTLTRVAATYVSRGDVATDAAATANARAADAKAEAKAATADTRAQDEEIRRLKDELAKSKEELDRIKKRLAEPPKKPPVEPPKKPPVLR